MSAMVMWLALSPAMAQDVFQNGEVPELNAQTFRPSLDSARTLVVDDALMPHEGGTVRVLLSYHDDLLVYTPNGTDQTKIVSSVFQTDLMGTVGVGPARIGLDVPIYLFADGDLTNGEAGLGDLAADLRFSLLGEGAPVEAPFQLGVQGRVILPTASVQNALGARLPGYRIALVSSVEIGKALLAANLGTAGLPSVALENGELNDAFEYRLGGAYGVTDRVDLSLELAGRLHYAEPVTNRVGQPLEALVGAVWRPEGNLVVRGGLARGLTPGIGSPDIRVILGLAYEPDAGGAEPRAVAKVVDSDGDGIADDLDKCPTEPEDVDEHLDDDGCPDPNADLLVRIVDEEGNPLRAANITVTPPEGDAITKRGAKKQLEAAPGTWTAEATATGYLPAKQEIAVVNGPPIEVEIALEPDPEAKVAVKGDRIDLRETVQFATNSARILPASRPLLDEVVRIMNDHPEVEQVSIEGHTDSRGNDAFNLDLSQRRARSVLDYLVSKGISADRLTSEGFGETKPLDPAETPEAWTKNRRVELKVTKWGDR